MLHQMDRMRSKEIALINKIKVMEKSRGGNFSKLSNTHAIDLNFTGNYNSVSPIPKHLENVARTGGFAKHKSEFKARKGTK